MKLSNLSDLKNLNDAVKENKISCKVSCLGGRRYRIGQGPSFSLNQLLQKVEQLSKNKESSPKELADALKNIQMLDNQGEKKLSKANPLVKKLTQLSRHLGGRFKKAHLQALIATAQPKDEVAKKPKGKVTKNPKDEVTAKPKDDVTAKPPETTPDSPALLTFATVKLLPTDKINKGPAKEIESFKPLNEAEVKALLDEVPELKNLKVAQGTLIAYDSILSIHNQGVPSKLGKNSPANKELQQNMQYILSKIKADSSGSSRKQRLLKLAQNMEDCLPVTQGNVGMMRLELATGKGIENQIALFILQAKDRAVDETIYEMHSEMQDPGYAATHHSQPWTQFPHVKTGYLHVVGEELGLNTTGAHEDPNKNTGLGARIQEFKETFAKKFSLEELLKSIIKDINLKQGFISNEDLLKWCGENELGFAAMFDDQKKYPSYAKPQEDFTSVCLDEDLAVKIFEKMGFITTQPKV